MSFRVLGVVLMAAALVGLMYVTTLVPPPAAHGRSAAALGKEVCVNKIGSSVLQFSVYQLQEPRGRYCREIPDVGPVTIVIDQADAELRDMTTDVRILKDVDAGSGVFPTSALPSDDLLVPGALDPFTERHVVPEASPTGIIKFEHTFTSPGQYHAMVTSTNDHGQVFVSEFPFRVGPADRRGMLLGLVLAAAAAGGGLLLAWRYGLVHRLWSHLARP